MQAFLSRNELFEDAPKLTISCFLDKETDTEIYRNAGNCFSFYSESNALLGWGAIVKKRFNMTFLLYLSTNQKTKL